MIDFRWIGSKERQHEPGVACFNFALSDKEVQVPMPNFRHAWTLYQTMQSELEHTRHRAREGMLQEIRLKVKP